ncbi:toxin co-regulated pilus biosynthesis Q family protein [Paraburkholderia sp. CNPSo 3076]|uniref:toxin co-regulated pilus biosynthesis Q family protein n=1 Tax=Paraburkholderia sp. CNPSo 3076 TaxID=2940936 RepID=UPI0022597CD3|nr:toxin co-regulated pilus biosynthesis Q family protein [Paraburkholderia sp. CNPSo 3076]MCX5544672.1 toxin co-regulated pilus biosynthesis Q family protein [Paraburkholderia sp. CNPSo 3076]
MSKHFPKDSGLYARKIAQALLALALAGAVTMAVAAMQPDQSKVPAPAGDGWQMLGSGGAPAAPQAASGGTAAPEQQPAHAPVSGQTPVAPTVLASAAPITPATPQASAGVSVDVKTVVVPGAASGEPTGMVSFTITPQDTNLRNALDRWLQTEGWQLAWKIDDDLPVEFNASFSGDFRSVLTQVMQATDHMRTPARVCRHTNNVVRVIARAANCKE